MKKTIYVLGFALALIACKQEVPVDYVLVSGKILNKSADFRIMLLDKSFTQNLDIADDGTFADTLRTKSGNYYFYDGRNMAVVYLDAGSNIVINADVNDFSNTVAFSGIGSEISTYILAKGKIRTEVMGKGATFYELEEINYKAKANEIKSTTENILNTSVGLSEGYKAKEKRNLNYTYLQLLSKYEQYHARYARKPNFKVSEGFLSELDTITYDNEIDFKFSQDYMQIVNDYYNKKAQELVKSDSLALDIAQLKTFDLIANETIKNDLLFEFTQKNIIYTNDIKEYYAAYMEASTNEDNNVKITEIYNKLKTIVKGQPSPKFENYENNAGGTTSLDDLKGKFVYIDVWATWCGPCMAEIPFLKEVEKVYHGKNIEFVSISIDRPAAYESWKKMIKGKELGGIQLLADKNSDSQFIQDYLIKRIPYFILVDPNGNIVSSNAPRPSSKDLIPFFNQQNI